jgi:hypothetical protein
MDFLYGECTPEEINAKKKLCTSIVYHMNICFERRIVSDARKAEYCLQRLLHLIKEKKIPYQKEIFQIAWGTGRDPFKFLSLEEFLIPSQAFYQLTLSQLKFHFIREVGKPIAYLDLHSCYVSKMAMAYSINSRKSWFQNTIIIGEHFNLGGRFHKCLFIVIDKHSSNKSRAQFVPYHRGAINSAQIISNSTGCFETIRQMCVDVYLQAGHKKTEAEVEHITFRLAHDFQTLVNKLGSA